MLPPHRPRAHAPLKMPNMRFVSIGECMVELAPALHVDDYKLGYAGDTFNTAWYMKSLLPDLTSRFVTRVGCDPVSERMLAMMSTAQIDISHIGRSADRTPGLYLINLTEGERSFSYWRDHSAAKQLADDPAALVRATQDGDVVYFSGITLAILDAKGRETLLDVVGDARATGKTTVFDPNLRPHLWESTHIMTQTIMQAAAICDIVLPSFDDEALHFKDVNITATRERYLNAGAASVVVKNGSGDVHFTHAGQTGAVTPPTSTQSVVDTTAAGDSFNAGFLVGLFETGDPSDAIVKASQVARHCISHKGALVPLPTNLIAQN